MKRTELKHRWILSHNIAQPHTAKIMEAWLDSKQIDVMQHPLYNPDFGPVRFLSVSDSQEIATSCQFSLENEVVNAVHTFPNGIPESEF